MQESKWQKRFERERASRKESEKLLEEKSLELYEANISLEKKVQERTAELEEALQEAKLAQKAKDAFFSSMSHELRTPLNAIIGFSQILVREPNLPPKIATYIEKINIAGNNLLSLINSVLNFSKIESDKMQINFQTIDLNSFLSNALVLIEPQVKAKEIEIEMSLQETQLSVDVHLMHQAVLNILSNAAKFTPQGGVISISAFKEEKNFVLKICDSGIGVSQEDQQLLFKPFSQVKSEEQAKVNGTGLGLYLARKIVELHGGEIFLTSKVHKGSCFSFVLPYKVK